MLDRATAVAKYCSLLLTAFALNACAKKTPAPEEMAKAPVTQTKDQQPTEKVGTAEAIARIAENLARVHFMFNSETMTEDSREALRENARILIAHPEISIEIQGHCDLRGTTEYNLALGQRRADSIGVYLTRSGVPASRVKSISFGEEKPLVEGESEHVWAQNRRAEFRVVTKASVVEVRGTTD